MTRQMPPSIPDTPENIMQALIAPQETVPKRCQHAHLVHDCRTVSGTFYCLCSVLDGYSRAIVHWDLREAMREVDVEIIIEATEPYRLRASSRLYNKPCDDPNQ